MSPRMNRPARNADEGGPVTIATLERALDVLQQLATEGEPDHGVSELAHSLGMSKGAVHRVLATFRTRGLVERHDVTQRYSLGPAALRLGVAYRDRADVTRLAGPVLERLSRRTRETATLSVRLGRGHRTYVSQVTPDREVIMSVGEGEANPLHEGASGRAFLAFLSEREREQHLALLGLCRSTSEPDLERLRQVLARTRVDGWARSRGERLEGASSVAAPVLDHRGLPVAVVSACGPAGRFDERLHAHVVHLLDATAELSAQFGWNV